MDSKVGIVYIVVNAYIEREFMAAPARYRKRLARGLLRIACHTPCRL